ncbi:zf-HC2 domain-containing protein [Ampullimonas aquatilis]|uniref:zf-HC2 domain-containing protein n=1 Tax=Ampullimonas aquatilis TaxID=1341549 RepID=UPI003C78B93B
MKLRYTCKEAHHLIVEGMDRHMNLGEKASLRMHLWVCSRCTSFSKQMSILRGAIKQLPLE